MGGPGSGPKPGRPRNPRLRAFGTPIDPRGPPVFRDVAHVLRRSTLENEPVFDLREATILCQDGSMANLLQVALKGPFIVQGNMDVEPDTEDRLIIPKCKSVHVQIPRCDTFSIGYGPLTLWAWSVGGWMEIKPTKGYREIYFQMFEAITLYWEVMAAYQDIERKLGKKSRAKVDKALAKASLEDVFYYYARNAGDGVLLAEVEQRCDRHAIFLLDQFDQELDYDWTKTSFFHWMQKRHPDIVAKLKAGKRDEPEPARPELPAENIPLITSILDEIADEAGGPNRVTYGRFTSQMFLKCKLSNNNYNIPKEIMQLYSADLLKTLDPDRWKGSDLWDKLEQEAKKPRADLVHLKSIDEIASRLVRRGHRSVTPRTERNYAGKTPSLRISKKRPVDVDSDEGPSRRGRPPEPEHNSDSDSDEKAVVRSYPLQQDTPTGPMGTWVCDQGCGHVVRSANEPEQRAKVLEHIRLHTADEMELVDQAREEGERNGLPVGNLLDKIIKAKNPEKIGGVSVPERIKRAQLGW